jgi:cardiolipin synthase A/B
MKLIIEPDDGIQPLLTAIQKAKKTIDVAIFRFDRADVERALVAAVERGVKVNALVAFRNRGGQKSLRKLEMPAWRRASPFLALPTI